MAYQTVNANEGRLGMITYTEGDLFASPAQTLVNPVNTVGVMGKGLAWQFKQRYPAMFQAYRTACSTHHLTVGQLQIFRAEAHWILNFPTKQHWRQPSTLTHIETGLQTFAATYAAEGITSIAFPALGCGLGQLRWSQVQPLMERYLHPLPIPVFIYAPRAS